MRVKIPSLTPYDGVFQVQTRITTLTAINNELDEFMRKRDALLEWAGELKNTINELKQRKARLRPEAAQHDINQV